MAAADFTLDKMNITDKNSNILWGQSRNMRNRRNIRTVISPFRVNRWT